MEAGPDDPLVGVYVVSQFIYCPRAGVIAYENREQHEDEPEPVNLDYMPIYDLPGLYERLHADFRELIWQALVMLGVLAFAYYLTARVHPNLAATGVMILVPLLGWTYPTLCDMADVGRKIVAHRSAAPKVPDPASDQFQPVNWCEMLKDGFISVPSKDRLRNDAWRVEGRPWRVLRKGNLHIPVFFQSVGETELRDKHLAKAAAHCFLLQTVALQDSPYAIVLKRGSFEGVTVPNHPRTRKVFYEGLRLARALIRDLRVGSAPNPPATEAPCLKCPLGEPVKFEPGESEHRANGVSLPVITIAEDGKPLCHSHCGDRFRWIPPHEWSENMRRA